MFRYILRRILQMIPTVLGVILITFVLFNVVGGSPARLTLGQHATAQALEEYDEVRGFNRPLLLGQWATTRALEDSDFARTAGAWVEIGDVIHRATEGKLAARIGLPPGRTYSLPLAFDLRDDAAYRVALEYRTADDARVNMFVQGGEGESNTLERIELPASRSWRSSELMVELDPEGRERVPAIEVQGADIEIKSVQLRRRMPSIFHSQLAFYLRQLVHFDFGESNSTNQKVSTLLLGGVIPSLQLTIPIFVIGLMVSVSLSLICAYFRNQFLDRFFVVLAVALMSINYLIFIILGQYFLAFKWQLFPVWGFESVHYLVLPVVIGVVSGLGANVRFYRTVMLDEMYKDYVRTAFAKGAGKPAVLFKHVLKNAMIPILTNVVIAIPFLYTGSLLLETFFGIPGLGYLAITAINASDVDVIRAIVLIGSLSFVVANLLTDICYAWADPRVTLK